ncbi:D-alanine--D-alanine ligase family protein [Lichenicoccus sp.]|uniref:D-alanine--D-alanine ligase family protein n=1 Tax=Lichenicoccus sp. TaxID=2781899 RepID=UPI003D12E70A
MAALEILCLVGSPTNDALRELSELYARGCIEALADPQHYAFTLAHVSPGPVWRLPESLDPAAIAAVSPLTLAAALTALAPRHFDIGLPQMFCLTGMTDYRSLLALMGLPSLGNRPAQMALTANKWRARALVAAAGVAVPNGELLLRGAQPRLAPPAVVKPNAADNSDGVSLVLTREAFPAALEAAFAHGPAVIVEDYIELGREVRCGVLERNGARHCLPLEEYFVDTAERPIRQRSDKLKRDAHGMLSLAAKAPRESWIVDDDDPIVATVHAAARRCHVALGCRQYSLFDFRVDRAGRVWFLEAGLYCSFSPQSVITTMAAAAGIGLRQLFDSVVAEAIDQDRLSGRMGRSETWPAL